MTLDQLRIYVKVIEIGSFTAAAERLDTPRSHVSRVIAQLEAELGVVLVERTTRSRSITEAGREVYERAVGILGAVDDTLRATQRLQDEPQGLLRLTCGVEFGQVLLGAWIEDYLGRYPKVAVEAEYTSRDLDLVHEGFDLAIRSGPLPDSRLVARPLGRFDYGLFASPGYLREHGSPQQPAALEAHSLVFFSGGAVKAGWTLHHPAHDAPAAVKAAARLRVNAGTGVRSALLQGLGIGQLPWAMADEAVAQGRLEPVLAPWAPAPVAVHAVVPSSRYLTPKVRAFIDLALERFPRVQGPAAATPQNVARSGASRRRQR
ncbi:MAG: LysR family transcriptional regulator [Burkholderiaceae bacterium]|jgi:DNA-binding transcriptional LysR family regulator|nr:LysR family transcriptional regulator [Burkholderiaceae bacterium]MCU0965301.1 LysR family transcriptional regulator [Burkholderiaceae bacterium]